MAMTAVLVFTRSHMYIISLMSAWGSTFSSTKPIRDQRYVPGRGSRGPCRAGYERVRTHLDTMLKDTENTVSSYSRQTCNLSDPVRSLIILHNKLFEKQIGAIFDSRKSYPPDARISGHRLYSSSVISILYYFSTYTHYRPASWLDWVLAPVIALSFSLKFAPIHSVPSDGYHTP